MNYYNIPDYTKAGIDSYVNEGIPPGDFIRGVLENNLKEAVSRADANNSIALKEIVMYCYNEIPFICWGSPEKVDAWLKMKWQQKIDQQTSKIP